MLAAAVRRGLRTPLLVGDLPFGSYEASDEQAIATAQRFVKEAGCDAVKLEGGGSSVQRAKAIVARRHPGDGPRRPDAADRDRARRLPRPGPHRQAAPWRSSGDALALQEAGCFSIVFEAIPAAVTEELMRRMEIPVIGIGAGPATDGQVLVFHDLLGIREGQGARFVKRYADVMDEMIAGVREYADDVRSQPLPDARAHLLDRPRGARGLPGADRRRRHPLVLRPQRVAARPARAFHKSFT